MKTVAIFEAKNRLSEILAAVAHGEEYAVTRHGKPIASIVPFRGAGEGLTPAQVEARRRAIARVRKFRQAHPVEDFDVRAAVEEGRD